MTQATALKIPDRGIEISPVVLDRRLPFRARELWVIYRDRGELTTKEDAAAALGCKPSTLQRLEQALVHYGYLTIARERSIDGVRYVRRVRLPDPPAQQQAS